MTDHPNSPTPNRRQFLILGAAAGGGLLAGCGLADPERQGRQPALPGGEALLPGSVALNAWIRLAPDGTVGVVVPRAEMGQGVHTALAMLVAEELEVEWSRVQVVAAPPGRVYANTVLLGAVLPLQPGDQGRFAQVARWGMAQTSVMLSLNITGGSTSVRAAWEPMRWAGASARSALIRTAARSWQVPPGECVARDGEVRHGASGRRLGYGELVRQWAERPLDPDPRLSLKEPGDWRLIGTSPPRLDAPAKTTGRARFGSDVSLPGLQRAVLKTCPHLGGRLVRVDDRAARAIPGVRAIHELKDGPLPAVAIVADHTWQALKAARALEVEWDPGLQTTLDTAAIRASLAQQLQEGEGTRFRREGDAPAKWEQAGNRVEAHYEVPYLAHAPMEPLNATVRLQDGRLDIWTGTQSPILARWRAAQIADLPIERVHLHDHLLGGGFGRRLETDVVEQATHLALRMPGVPVQLMWTREQDLRHDVYRPAARAHLRAALKTGPAGRLEALHVRVGAASVSDATSRRLLPKALTDLMPQTPDKVQIEGAYDLPYGVPDLLVEQVLTRSPLPIGSWRSVGHSYNAFFIECFLDEVAQVLEQDPLALRLSLLAQRPRHRAVLEAAARRAGWSQSAPAGRARGLALHESFGSICAQVAEVSIDRGRVRVHRITCAFDGGTLVHPDGVRAQLEGGIVFGLSAALWGEVPVEQGQVTLRSWADYPVLRMADMPVIDIELMPSAAAPGGVGEPGTPPVAPAVVNALANLEGRRRRTLPLMPRGRLLPAA